MAAKNIEAEKTDTTWHGELLSELAGIEVDIRATKASASRPTFQVDLTRYKQGKPLGSGAFGVVYCYELITTAAAEYAKIAVKKLPYVSDKEKRQIDNEIDILSKLSTLEHGNIVRYLGHNLEDNHLLIILEFMQGGSIEDHLKLGEFTEKRTGKYTRDILEGLQYLHSQNIIHRDIKGGNVLIDSGDTAKLADFGISKELRTCAATSGGHTFAGTIQFMAPEVAKAGDKETSAYGRKSDIWSVGCVVVQMLTARPPWERYNQFRLTLAVGSLRSGEHPKYELPENTSEQARDFINGCLTANYKKRPSAVQLLDHGFCPRAEPDTKWHENILVELAGMLRDDVQKLKPCLGAMNILNQNKLARCTDFISIWHELERAGKLEVGEYNELSELMEMLKRMDCVGVIDDHKGKIEDYRRKIEEDRAKKCGESLVQAAGNGDTTAVRNLLLEGADVDYERDLDGCTALIRASYFGHLALVETLLKGGAEIDKEDKKGWTALMHASQNGHLDVADALMKAGAEIDKEEEDGVTALMIASQNGHLDVVNALMKAGAEIDKEEEDGFTALMMASQNGHIDVVNALMKAGAEINKENKDGVTALMIASHDGHIDVVNALMKGGAEINKEEEKGFTALMIASQDGHIDVVNALMKAGAEINKENKAGMTALMLASGHLAVVDALLKGGAEKADQRGWTALMIASRQGHLDVVDALMKARAEINKADQHGGTALMTASYSGHLDVVDALMKAGAEIDKANKNGDTALSLAEQEGHKEVAELLKKFGAKRY